MKNPMTRRRFLHRAASLTAGALSVPIIIPSSVLGKNDAISPSNRITIGCIGVGSHGAGVNLKSFLSQPDARVVAVCDVDRNHLEQARQIVNAQYAHTDCSSYADFREVLARADVDAVMISTPDHWHTPISIMAARAGKDIICEKPTLCISEGRTLIDTIRRYGRVFQTSTEDRSLFVYHRMAELVRNGRIGRLHTIEVELPRQPGRPGNPQPMPIPKELDYDMWLGPAPDAPYTKDRIHFDFRWIWDYSGGIITDWGTHLFDTAQWGNDTELSGPVAIEGRATFWEEGLFNTPKDYDIEYQYENGVRMTCRAGNPSIRFIGSEGWIGNRGWIGPLQAEPANILDSVIGPDEIHLYTCPGGEHRNFLDCVKTRKDPYFPVEIGHRVSTVCHLANIAIRLGHPLKWDPQNEVFIQDEQANRMRDRFMRSPWTI